MNTSCSREQFLFMAALAPLASRIPAVAPARLGDWSHVRREFALAPNVTQLAAFVLASHPRPVREAVERHRRGLDANPHGYLDRAVSFEERARSAAARYVGSSPEQVALTDSTTMSLGLLYGGLRLRPGDEVLTTVHDFYSTHASLQLRAAATGARVRKITLYADPRHASEDEIVSNVVAGLKRETRYVAITWVHSSTGVKLPVRGIADAIAKANESRSAAQRVLLCVDGVHGFGVEADRVASLGCDYFASGCHKWLFGPRGTGLLWAKDASWPDAAAIIPTFDHDTIGAWIFNRPWPAASGAGFTPGGYHSFEHRWALTEAFEFHRRIGVARIAARTYALAARLKAELAQIKGVAVQTPSSAALSAGLVCCSITNHDPDDFVQELYERHRVVATVAPYASQLIRFGPTIANSDDDVEHAVKAVHALA
jgi:selenocysteine lyase/cysteine desulfurase